jgi:biopolymer transport protein ExbD
MKFKRSRELPRARIEIIPMIDTIFFLLVFFMLSSLSLSRLTGMALDLPEAKTGQSQPSSDLTLSIDARGSLALGPQRTTWRELPSLLQGEVSRRGGPRRVSLLLSIDERVPHGTVVRALDAARSLGITSYGLATVPARPDGE